MSEDYIVRHGAPVLAGLKTGNLFPCSFACRETLFAELREINRRLVPLGIRLIPLRLEPSRVLLYLFRPAALERDLSRKEARLLLAERGYGSTRLLSCLTRLQKRLRQGGAFPHEIGLFLSYPPEDVREFIRLGGRSCKASGCWKVYGDVTAAKQKFAAYKACTALACRRLAEGTTLEELAGGKVLC